MDEKQATSRRKMLMTTLGGAVALSTSGVAKASDGSAQVPNGPKPTSSTQTPNTSFGAKLADRKAAVEGTLNAVESKLPPVTAAPGANAANVLGARGRPIAQAGGAATSTGGAPVARSLGQGPDHASANWSTLAQLATTYINQVKLMAGDSAPQSARIDAHFSFSSLATDALFRSQFADVLLDQSADLMERALSQRSEWNELFSKAFNVQLELRQYLALDAIHHDETTAGFYTHDSAEAVQDFQAEVMTQQVMGGHASFLQGVLADYFDNTDVTKQSAASQKLAWLSHLANYDGEASGDQSQYTFDNVQKTSAAHAQDAATDMSYFNLNVQDRMLYSQGLIMRNNSTIASARASSAKVRMDWEQVNAGFRQRRTDVAREIADAKLTAYVQPGGALNYFERMDFLRKRYERDLRDALARVSAAVKGLAELYNYHEPLPQSVSSSVATSGALTAGGADECLVWVRDAIAYLIRFNQMEQKFSMPISLRDQLGETKFRAGAGGDAPQWKFELPASTFDDEYHVRLRGISVYIVPKRPAIPIGEIIHAHGVWGATVTVPRTALLENLPVGGAAATKVTLEQSHIPQVASARVTYREARRAADVVGSSALYNVSPISSPGMPWVVTLDDESSEGVPSGDLHDVMIDLHLSCRRR